MRKPIPITFTVQDLRKGESIYFVGHKTVNPMPIDEKEDSDWGYYFPNKEEAEKFAIEYKAYLETFNINTTLLRRFLGKIGLINK